MSKFYKNYYKTGLSIDSASFFDYYNFRLNEEPILPSNISPQAPPSGPGGGLPLPTGSAPIGGGGLPGGLPSGLDGLSAGLPGGNLVGGNVPVDKVMKLTSYNAWKSLERIFNGKDRVKKDAE
jgi:hypothetical protein